MRIISITWAHNEEDILEDFARHHCAFLTKMVFVLHRCNDRSREILLQLQAEGLPIEIHGDERVPHQQAEVLTAFMHTCAHTDAPDWILPLDADEFLVSRDGTPLQKLLHSLHEDPIPVLPWCTYIPTSIDDEHECHPIKRIVHHRDQESRLLFKVLVPLRYARLLDTALPLGNHSVFYDGSPLLLRIQEQLLLAHFPVRTEKQLRHKVVHGWKSLCANPNYESGECFHWEELYNRCREPRPISREELQDIATHYCLHPEDKKATITIVRDPLLTSPFHLTPSFPLVPLQIAT